MSANTETQNPAMFPTQDVCPDSPVAILHEERATLRVGTQEADGDLQIHYRWPGGVTWTAHGTADFYLRHPGEAWVELDLELPQLDVRLPATAHTVKQKWPSGEFELCGHFSEPVDVVSAAPSLVVFHVANLPRWHRIGEIGFEAGCLLMEADGWQVRLAQLGDARNKHEQLQEQGGLAVTHVGDLQQTSEAPFDWSSAMQLLDALQLLLSHAAGDRAPILAPLGLDSQEEIVARRWASPKAASYRNRLRWWPPFEAGALASVFPGWLQMCLDSRWAERLHIIIEMYLDAQLGNLETRVVTAHAGLELLAWQWLVVVEQRYDPRLFDKRSSDQRLRSLLGRIGITSAIPTHLTHLQRASDSRDGPRMIADLRHSVVHPPKLNALPSSPDVIADALELAFWYFDLGLLRLTDYRGQYLNRTQHGKAVGDTELVPWSS